jgi:hypothetical protein
MTYDTQLDWTNRVFTGANVMFPEDTCGPFTGSQAHIATTARLLPNSGTTFLGYRSAVVLFESSIGEQYGLLCCSHQRG